MEVEWVCMLKEMIGGSRRFLYCLELENLKEEVFDDGGFFFIFEVVLLLVIEFLFFFYLICYKN